MKNLDNKKINTNIDREVDKIYKRLTKKGLSVEEVRKVTYRVNKKVAENAHV